MTPTHDLLKSLFIMSFMVEARDPYTGGHLWRVSQFSRLLAENMDLPARDVARITVGGFLHDLGKIGVPDGILNKPDRLTQDEYAIMQTHPKVGSRLLSDHPLADLVREAVHAHHETPDGRGYPRRLSGEDIALDARIVGIADAFDAMTSTRPYRRGMPVVKALSILEENLGRQFDPVLGAAFLDLGAQGRLDSIVGHSEPHIPMQVCPMCGPIIVVTRRHVHGSHVYCRNCGAEATVVRDGSAISLSPTGRNGDPADLEPEADDDLLEHLVEESGRVIRMRQKRRGSLFERLFHHLAAAARPTPARAD